MRPTIRTVALSMLVAALTLSAVAIMPEPGVEPGRRDDNALHRPRYRAGVHQAMQTMHQAGSIRPNWIDPGDRAQG